MKSDLKSIIVMILSIVFLFSASSMASEKNINFSGIWSAGGIGGTWFSMAVTSAKIINDNYPGISFKAVPGGGVINPTRIVAKEADLSYGVTPALKLYVEKEGPYKGKDIDASKLRVIGESFLDNELNFLAAEETGVKSMEDFVQMVKEKKGVKLAIGGYNMTDIFLFEKILKFYDISLDDIRDNGKILMGGYSEGANNMADKHADFWLVFLRCDSSAIIQASVARKLNLIPYPKDLLEYVKKEAWLVEKVLKGGINPNIETEGKSVAVGGSTLITNADIDEQIIYLVTKSLCENLEDLYMVEGARDFKPENAGKNAANILLHPGAVKYYEEMGYSYNLGKVYK